MIYILHVEIFAVYFDMRITCSVGVVVALQPGLHTNQIMLIHKENYVLGPKNLT